MRGGQRCEIGLDERSNHFEVEGAYQIECKVTEVSEAVFEKLKSVVQFDFGQDFL